MVRPRSILSFAVLLTLCSSALAQPPSSRGSFAIPERGTKLPTVDVFDEQGKPFSTAQLREHYTVLVFGCLT